MRDHQHAAHDSYVVGAVAAESEQLLELVRRVQTYEYGIVIFF